MCLSKKDLMTNNDNTDLVLHRAFVVLLIRNNTHELQLSKKKDVVLCDRQSATTTQNNRVSDPSSLEAIRIFKARWPASCFSKIKKKLKKALPLLLFLLSWAILFFPHFSNTFFFSFLCFPFYIFRPLSRPFFFPLPFFHHHHHLFSWLWNFCYFYFVFRFFKNMLGG